MTESDNEEYLLEEFLSHFPREKVGDEETYRKLVEYAINVFTKVCHHYIWTTPLVEVFHVSIHTDSPIFDDGNPFQLFGTIRVIFGDEIVHHLYLRDRDHPQTLSIGGKISLMVPKGCAIFSSADFRVEVDLNHISREGDEFQISKGVLSCKFENQDDFEQVKTECVHGRHGFAAVEYIAFRHAVIANLRVAFVNGINTLSSGGSVIYGNITANFGNAYICKIFEKMPSEAVTVEYGADIPLSRNVVVVPAHSWLVIRANLWTGDGQKIVCRDTKFTFDNFGHPYWKNLAENGSILVEVMWENSCMLPSPLSTLKDQCEETTHFHKTNCGNFDQLGQLPFFSDVRHSPSIRKASLIQPFTHSVKEVFSVLIGSFKDTPSTVYGSIIVEGEFMMFDRKPENPVGLLHNQTIPIVFPLYSFVGTGFYVGVDLNAADGAPMGRGSLEWTERDTNFQNECQLSWYDKHLSSVFQGEHGYVAMHYMMIYRGFQAIMNVRFVSKSFSPVRARVWGGLVGRYSNHRYPTHYEKEYFRLKILWVSQDRWLALSSGDQIPLERPVMAVPDKSSLIVDVDLHVRIDGDDDGDGSGESSKREALRGFCVEFRTDTDYTDSPVVIEGKHCSILFSVRWRSGIEALKALDIAEDVRTQPIGCGQTSGPGTLRPSLE